MNVTGEKRQKKSFGLSIVDQESRLIPKYKKSWRKLIKQIHQHLNAAPLDSPAEASLHCSVLGKTTFTNEGENGHALRESTFI